MFTCISSKKQNSEEDHEGGSSRSSSKSITAQMKDLATKVSKSLHLKGNTGSIPMTTENIQQHEDNTGPIPMIEENTQQHEVVEFSGFQTTTEEPLISFGGFPSFFIRRPTPTPVSEIVEEEVERFKEWTIEVDDGVHITFKPLPDGGNTILRIKFSHLNYNQLQAQTWWVDNYDQIIKFYNVRRAHEYHNIEITHPEHEVVEDRPLEEAPNPTLGNLQEGPESLSFREWLNGMSSSDPNEGM